MKLKTLKDLGKTTILVPDVSKQKPCSHPTIPEEHIIIKELKQEAIKWIKEVIMPRKDFYKRFKKKEIVEIIQGEINNWCNFFNISKEDLNNASSKSSKG